MQKKKGIPVIFAADDNFYLPLYVSIKSLFANKNESTEYIVYVLYREFSLSRMNQIRSISTGNIEFVHVEEINNDSLSVSSDNYNTDITFIRFYIESLFPEFDKVLYLDADVIIQRDIQKLYDIDIEDYYAAVISDLFTENRLFEIDRDTKDYFNAGVLLLNLQMFRRDSISEKMLSVDKTYVFADQAILNTVIGDNVRYISERYNFICDTYRFDDFSICKKYYSFEPYSSFKEYVDNSVVLHLATAFKPWQYDWGYLSELFFKYCDFLEYDKVKKMLLPLLEDENKLGIPYFEIPIGSKVLLYGANKLGKDYYNHITDNDLFEIVNWVDSNAYNFRLLGWPVNDKDTICMTKFDYVIIAVRTERVAGEISKELVEMGVNCSKVLWSNKRVRYSNDRSIGHLRKTIQFKVEQNE